MRYSDLSRAASASFSHQNLQDVAGNVYEGRAQRGSNYSSAIFNAAYNSTASYTPPRPSQLVDTPLSRPAPQWITGQFSLKLSTKTQKKHVCKICNKRFTRPSSVQTHLYSHTGEKPFACNIESCGRRFSVMSNLRRHKKVHKKEASEGKERKYDTRQDLEWW